MTDVARDDLARVRRHFMGHMARFTLIATSVLLVSLLIGMLGYHWTAHLGWLDSLLNASMILTGMGPVDKLETPAAKLFASFYALFSGVVFLTMMAFLMGPVMHRVLHIFHLEKTRDEKAGAAKTPKAAAGTTRRKVD